MLEKLDSFYREAVILEKELGSENLDDSRKQALCSNLEQLVTQLDSIHAALIQILRSNIAAEWLTTLNEN